jgi:hypothetical protein
MSDANPLWGAPKIHGELLKLGIDVSQATVSRYIRKKTKPPSQTWRTFLDNHVGQLVSVDFFTVSTVWFQILLGSSSFDMIGGKWSTSTLRLIRPPPGLRNKSSRHFPSTPLRILAPGSRQRLWKCIQEPNDGHEY